MIASVFVAIILANLSLAMSESDRRANLDAEQSFREFEKSIQELSEKNQESAAEFDSKRWPIENGFKKYCDSMQKYPKIYLKCVPMKKMAANRLDQRAAVLAKIIKEDKYLEATKKLDLFLRRATDLRSVQNNGKNIEPDTLREKRLALEKEMLEYCPLAPRAELTESCIREVSRIKIRLANYEYDLRSGAFIDPPPQKRKYSDITPMLRCFFDLPKLRDASLQYEISDPSGRYRYEHLTKSAYGYALNVKLSEFTKRNVNHSLTIQKKMTDPRSANSYTATISSVFFCAPDGTTPPNCQAKALGLTVTHANTRVNGASATVPIALDTSFSISLPLDENGLEEFRLDCAVAAKMRKGGWIYSDAAFEEK